MTKVFTYGSLMRGFRNHSVLMCPGDESKFLGEASVNGFTLYGPELNGKVYGFPYAVPDAGAAVDGEVYEVSEWTFRDLDKLESYPGHYDRVLAHTPYGQAWIYFASSAWWDPAGWRTDLVPIGRSWRAATTASARSLPQ